MRLFNSNVTCINCLIADNAATTLNSNGFGGGGAISSVSQTSLTLVNCTVADNTVSPTHESPGIYTSSGALIIRNCTIVNNTVNGAPPPNTVGGVLSSAVVEISNSIVYDNEGMQISNPAAQTTFTCVQGGYAGEGNIAEPPQFVDAADGDYRLALGSPGIDGGSLEYLPSDEFDLDADGDAKEYISRDLAGARRIVNGFVDMGAFEWQRTCLADISPSSPGVAGDGTINVDDLLAVINGWGECDGCVADVNNDNSVDVDDLLEVINGWGACK